LGARVTPATSLAPICRQEASHSQNVTGEENMRYSAVSRQKKYEQQGKMKYLCGHSHYSKVVLFIDEIKKIG
jgi:hypothetical protein